MKSMKNDKLKQKLIKIISWKKFNSISKKINEKSKDEKKQKNFREKLPEKQYLKISQKILVVNFFLI